MTYSSDLWPMIVAAICALLWILLGVIIMIALKSEKNRKIKHMKRAGILCWYVYSKNFLINIGSYFRAILAPLRYNTNKNCTLIWCFFFIFHVPWWPYVLSYMFIIIDHYIIGLILIDCYCLIVMYFHIPLNLFSKISKMGYIHDRENPPRILNYRNQYIYSFIDALIIF